MAKHRADRNPGTFTTIGKYHLTDKRLSLKAVGLFTIMLDLPDDWDYSINGLAKKCGKGRVEVESALKELEKYGYLKRSRVRGNARIIDTEYEIYEDPNKNPDIKSKAMQNKNEDGFAEENAEFKETPYTSSGASEECDQSYPDTSGLLNDVCRHKYGMYENVILSDSDMEKLKQEFPNDYEERIDRLSEYMESTGKTYSSHLATIRSWARKDRGKMDLEKQEGISNATTATLAKTRPAAPKYTGGSAYNSSIDQRYHPDESTLSDVKWIQEFMNKNGDEFSSKPS